MSEQLEGMGEESQYSHIIPVNEATKLLKIKADEKKSWEKHSIYKLPALVTELNPNAYKPRAISFGPYHYGEENLEPMESHKHRVLLRFLNRCGKSIDECINALNDVAEDLKDAYDSLDDLKCGKDPKAFMELMIRDGCFMLEIFRYNDGQRKDDYDENDPIFSYHGILYMMPYIRRDMMMLENQLPMLLLTKLLYVEDQNAKENKDEYYINKLAVKFCSPTTPYENLSKKCKAELKTCKHLLDAYRKILINDGVAPKLDTSPTSEGVGHDILPSATRLHEAGIQIKRSQKMSIVEGISFNSTCCGVFRGIFHGVLSLPQIIVDDTTESMFLNLIAFERFHPRIGNEVTSYISFMDDIIDNERDVNLLQSNDVVQNAYGSEKAVAKLFNSLARDITLDPNSRLFSVRSDADNYCKNQFNRWWGNLIHTYFTNPWSVISVIAAILLFGLTIIQTVFTITGGN